MNKEAAEILFNYMNETQKYLCRCRCHDFDDFVGIKHIVTCCDRCIFCGARIILHHIKEHESYCEGINEKIKCNEFVIER